MHTLDYTRTECGDDGTCCFQWLKGTESALISKYWSWKIKTEVVKLKEGALKMESGALKQAFMNFSLGG